MSRELAHESRTSTRDENWGVKQTTSQAQELLLESTDHTNKQTTLTTNTKDSKVHKQHRPHTDKDNRQTTQTIQTED
uniref:Uncharacterized protein n=1 Tax=Arion vulgaris TaxID=1028688 RepID=A0A0B6YVL3_9EUPU